MLHLNQSTFANSLGMTQPNISRMVSGASNISVEVLHRITERYKEVNLHWLLTGEGEMFFEHRNTGVQEDPPMYGKGRLEELEERVDRLEETVKQWVKKTTL